MVSNKIIQGIQLLVRYNTIQAILLISVTKKKKKKKKIQAICSNITMQVI